MLLKLPSLWSVLALQSWAQELSRLDLPRQICAPESMWPSFLWSSPLHRYRFILEPDDNVWSKGKWVIISSFAAGGADPELRIMKPLCKGGICDLFPDLYEWLWNCNEDSCPAFCSWVSKHGGCVLDFPPAGGCVKITKLGKGALRSTVSWQVGWDLKLVLQVVVGAALFKCRNHLREAKLVHALIGACFIIIFCVIMVVYFTYSYSRRVASHVPLLGFFVTLSPLFFLTAPTWYLATVVPTSWNLIWNILQPWLYSVTGFCAFAAISVFGARCGLKWFASDFEEPAGQVDFTIGSDGRRIDKLPAYPWQQRLLGFVLGVLGIVLLLTGTHNKYFSALITLIVLLQEHAAQYIWESRALKEVVKPEYFRQLMSRGDYEEEGYKKTAQALDSLKEFACSNPQTFLCLRDPESELRFRRFADGWGHIRLPCEEEDDPYHPWCVIL